MGEVVAFVAYPSEISGGTYLRKRREAAGVTIEEAAAIYALDLGIRASVMLMIKEIEQDKRWASDTALQRLRLAFRFDPHVYRQLVSGLPAGQICRGCACTWDDACIEEGHGACAWSASDPTLCTACERKSA